MGVLNNKHIVLGITGGIAAYKAAELTRFLVKAGAQVRVVMTASAQEFITPLTLQALSGLPVHTSLLDPEAEAGMGHIELARWAQLLLVAPASANFLARMAQGVADDLLSTLCLASRAPIAVAPAMNQAMWANVATQTNLNTLFERGVHIWGPDSGVQACGDVGLGRMLEPQALLEHVQNHFGTGLLAGKKVVITAGPTQEPIDPVRYLSNRSSGKMGYALAEAALAASAEVVLISGPSALPAVAGVTMKYVETAEQMLAASVAELASMDIFIAAAAVADYRPAEAATQKIKKQAQEETRVITLVQNPDIVATIAAQNPRPFTVGFAAETERLVEFAHNKLVRKGLDMVIANDVSQPNIGFNSDRNAVEVVTAAGTQSLQEQNKQQLAHDLIALIATHYVQSLA